MGAVPEVVGAVAVGVAVAGDGDAVDEVVGDGSSAVAVAVPGDEVGEVVGNVTSAVSNVFNKGAVVVTNTAVGSKGMISGTVVELVISLASDLASGLPAESEFRLKELSFRLGLPPQVRAALNLDLESTFVSRWETNGALDVVPTFTTNLEAGSEVVAAVAD